MGIHPLPRLLAPARAVEAFCEEHAAPFGLLLYDGEEAYQLTRRVAAVTLGSVL